MEAVELTEEQKAYMEQVRAQGMGLLGGVRLGGGAAGVGDAGCGKHGLAAGCGAGGGRWKGQLCSRAWQFGYHGQGTACFVLLLIAL